MVWLSDGEDDAVEYRDERVDSVKSSWNSGTPLTMVASCSTGRNPTKAATRTRGSQLLVERKTGGRGRTSERAEGDADLRLGVRVDEVAVLALATLLLLIQLWEEAGQLNPSRGERRKERLQTHPLAEALVRVALERERLVEREDLEQVREVGRVLARHLLVGDELVAEVEGRVALDERLELLVGALDLRRPVLVRAANPQLAVGLVGLDAAVLVDAALEGRRREGEGGGPRVHALTAVGKGLEEGLDLYDARVRHAGRGGRGWFGRAGGERARVVGECGGGWVLVLEGVDGGQESKQGDGGEPQEQRASATLADLGCDDVGVEKR